MDIVKMLEGSLNELEDLSKTLSQMKNPILESSLNSFKFIFEKDKEGKAAYQHMEVKDAKETLNALKTDLLPLFIEFEYEEGLNQTKEWIKLLEEYVRK